jgi:hypothetical protein
MLKISVAFLDKHPPSFSVFHTTLRSVCGSVLETVYSVLFGLLEVSWVIIGPIDFLFLESPQKEIHVNTQCAHLHSFCAVGMSSGLAVGLTLTRVSQRRLGEPLHWVGPLLVLFL